MNKQVTLWLLLVALAAGPAAATDRSEALGRVEPSRAQGLPAVAADFLAGSAHWTDDDSRQALMKALSQWLTENCDVPSTPELPRVMQATSDSISALRYGRLPGTNQASDSAVRANGHSTVAVYVERERTVYLPENFKGNTPAELSVLVHEMVHHIQIAARLQYDCPQAREKPAYLAQQRWLRLFDRDLWTEFQIDALTIFVNSACFH